MQGLPVWVLFEVGWEFIANYHGGDGIIRCQVHTVP
jgi:hypothetical protein